MTSFGNFVAFLSGEFHRYLIENESLAQGIPDNALIVFDVVGEPDFNKWHHETSMRNREPGQPVFEVHVGKLRTHSAIEDVHLTPVLA
jgi:hypothetical protein